MAGIGNRQGLVRGHSVTRLATRAVVWEVVSLEGPSFDCQARVWRWGEMGTGRDISAQSAVGNLQGLSFIA